MANEDYINIITKILALMIAIIGHEIMHGYVAYRYGDNTAKNAGRLSINPIKHVDLVGTIILPALLYISHAPFLFGWAKPVPINMREVLDNGGYKAAIFVSLAGIAYNFTLAIACTVILSQLSTPTTIFGMFFAYLMIQSLIYNVVLGVFNLYPIPPLDGSHALAYFAASNGWYGIMRFFDSIQKYGMIILLLFIATPLSNYFFAPIGYIIDYLMKLV
ncbi:MAG: site-2 protease family protein [Sulfurospirillaceae bacterium]|nr:site-2 protease family protein [Sulfurospirillaceae bacterium]